MNDSRFQAFRSFLQILIGPDQAWEHSQLVSASFMAAGEALRGWPPRSQALSIAGHCWKLKTCVSYLPRTLRSLQPEVFRTFGVVFTLIFITAGWDVGRTEPNPSLLCSDFTGCATKPSMR